MWKESMFCLVIQGACKVRAILDSKREEFVWKKHFSYNSGIFALLIRNNDLMTLS